MARDALYTISEFSQITGLTVKTLRFYHERGLLLPSCIDDETGYRYYDRSRVETARVIARLKALGFSLDEIADVLRDCGDEADLLEFLERRRESLAAQLRRVRAVLARLERLIASEREARKTMQNATFQIEEKTLEPLLVAGLRMRGRYCECGKAFGRIGRRYGRFLCGPPLLLLYDCEYKEEDADFEACMPVRGGGERDGITVRELPGGRCVSLLHRGPYDDLGRSYAQLFDRINSEGLTAEIPTRQLCLKGPGMIFRGNPKNYLTELQILVR